MDRPRILLLDRPSPSVRTLAASLADHGFHVQQTAEPAEAVAAIRAQECEVVLSEIHLAAEDVLDEVRASADAPPLILFDDFGVGANAERWAGAFEALARPVADDDVLRVVRRALESHTLRLENARLKDALGPRAGFGEDRKSTRLNSSH